VIQKWNADEIAGFSQPIGDLDVFVAGGGIPGGVIVEDENRCGPFPDSRRKHFPGMDHGTVQGPFADQNLSKDPVLGVQEDGQEMLLLLTAKAVMVKVVNALGVTNPFYGSYFFSSNVREELENSLETKSHLGGEVIGKVFRGSTQ